MAAVGPATADALRRAGIEPDLVPAEHSARGLVEEFPDAGAASGSRRVLFPCADLAPDTIPERARPEGLGGARASRPTAPCRAAAPEPALLDRVAAADAVTFTAASAVQAFVALRSAAGEPVTPPAHIVCIGTDHGRGSPRRRAARRARGLRCVGPGHRRRVDRRRWDPAGTTAP